MQKYLLQNFRHYLICIATVKSLQSSRVYLRLFCQTTIIEMPSLIRKKKLHVKIVVPKLQEIKLYGTRSVVQLVHCIVPNDPNSPQYPKMI